MMLQARVQNILDLIQNEITFEFARSSGAGGQNVNKVSSKAILRWNLPESLLYEPDKSILIAKLSSRLVLSGDLIISSEEFRDQPANKKRCLDKLEAMLILALTPVKRRIKTKPTKSSKKKRLETKRIHKDKKDSRRKVGWE